MKRLWTVFMTAVLCSVLLASVVSAQKWVPTGATNHLNVAQMGMGGLTTTISTNAHTLFYNPGLLTRQKFALEITPLVLGLGDKFSDVVDIATEWADTMEALDQALSDPEVANMFYDDIQKIDNQFMGVKILPYFGLAWKNFGIGAYGAVNADVAIDQGVTIPAAGIRGYADVVVGVGFARTIDFMGKDYGLGVTGRFINRRVLPYQRVDAKEVSDGTELSQTMMDALEDSKSGIGIDVGLYREVSERLDYGIVAKDLIGTLDGWVKPGIQVGAMYHVPFAGNALIRRWDFGVEVVDILNREGVSLFQKINMGTELNILAGLIKVRAGFHQGYPTFGAGVSLLFLKVDYAYFTRELGNAPGYMPETTHFVQLSLAF